MGTQREAEVNGIRLSYQVSGEPGAPPMVLLHGLGESSASWDEVGGAFARDYQVFAVDQRGHGRSDWPGTYSFALLRDDVLGLLDQLGLDQVTLVGHSMGGHTALLAAEAQPGRVSRLVGEDSPPPYPRDRPIPDRPDPPLRFDWGVVSPILGEVNRGDEAAWAALGQITAPTLLIGGGPDSQVRQDKLAEAARRIPHGQFITIPAGHYVHNNRPAEFTAAVLDWLRDTAR